MRVHFLQRWWALAAICIGCLTLCAPAVAGPVGVSLTASGGAGDVSCSNSTFGTAGTETDPTSLTFSGSASGYNNGPTCGPPPALGTSSVNASAALGMLSSDDTASLTGSASALNPLPGASDTLTWGEAFLASVTGEYLLIFTLNDSETATQSYCSGTPQAQVIYNVYVTIAASLVSAASWDNTDCAPNAGPTVTKGNVAFSNSNTVEFELTVNAGSFFDVSTNLMVSAQVARQLTSGSDSVVADVNSAAFTYSQSPEPASWLLAGCGLAALGLSARIRLRNKA